MKRRFVHIVPARLRLGKRSPQDLQEPAQRYKDPIDRVVPVKRFSSKKNVEFGAYSFYSGMIQLFFNQNGKNTGVVPLKKRRCRIS